MKKKLSIIGLLVVLSIVALQAQLSIRNGGTMVIPSPLIVQGTLTVQSATGDPGNFTTPGTNFVLESDVLTVNNSNVFNAFGQLNSAVITNGGNITITGLTGGLNFKTAVAGSGRSGTAVLASGAVAVSNTNVAAGDIILLSYQTSGTSVGYLCATLTNAVGFRIVSYTNTGAGATISTNQLDTNIVAWLLIHNI